MDMFFTENNQLEVGGNVKKKYKIIHSGKYPFHVIPIITAIIKFRYNLKEMQKE